MSDPVTPVGQVPPAAPPKKKKTGKILLIIFAVLVVLCGAGGYAAYKLLGKAVDVAYAEGNCLDTLPTGAAAASAVPKPVLCTDSKAVAKILKVEDGKTAADAETVCGAVTGATSFVMITKTDGTNKLL